MTVCARVRALPSGRLGPRSSGHLGPQPRSSGRLGPQPQARSRFAFVAATIAYFVASTHAALADAKAPAKAAPASSTAAAAPAPPPAAAAASASPPDALNDNASSPTIDAQKARARKLYERGAQAYAEGRFFAAADLFLETHRVYPTPQLLFNIGRAFDKLGNISGALRYYRDYLRQAPGSSDENEVTTRVRELESELEQRGTQQLTVLTDPEGATVLLDGQPVGLSPFTGNTYPGKHRVTLVLAGHQTMDDVIELDPHRAQDFTYKLSPPPVTAAEAAERAAQEQPPASVTPLTWVVLGSGVALLGAALIVEMAVHEERGLSKPGAFLAGGGLATTAVGGVLLYSDLSTPSKPGSNATATQARLNFGVSERSARATVSLTF